MRRLSARAIVAALAAVALVALAGTAIAATGGKGATPSGFLDSVAKHLGISRDKLDDAVQAARIDQVEALLAQGRITKEQADQLEERIRSGAPAFGGHGLGHGFGFGLGRHGGRLFGGGLESAAAYLGLTEAQLAERLADGKSLADVAKAEGKSVDGLVDALVADAKKRLDAAVADGHLTEQQAKDMLDRITEGTKALVERSFDGAPSGRAFGGKGWFGRHGDGGMWRAPGASAPLPLAPLPGVPA